MQCRRWTRTFRTGHRCDTLPAVHLELTPPVLILCALAIGSPWVLILVILSDKKRFELLWRETLVSLKSATAYEAADALDRMKSRTQSMLEKGLATFKKQKENPADDAFADMSDDMRETLRKQYAAGAEDNGTGK